MISYTSSDIKKEGWKLTLTTITLLVKRLNPIFEQNPFESKVPISQKNSSPLTSLSSNESPVIVFFLVNRKLSSNYRNLRLKPWICTIYSVEELRPVRLSQTKKPSFIVNDTHAIQVIGCQLSTNQTRPEMYRIVNHPPTPNHPRFRISGQINLKHL